ncbi:MAG: hypothetical protein ACXIUM_13105 [Wenzhouxiangella sp.]
MATGSSLGPIVFGRSVFGPDLPRELGPATDLCRVHPLADGSALTFFGAHSGPTQTRDGGGGLWLLRDQMGFERHAANCSVEAWFFQETSDIHHLIAHPSKRAAFALGQYGSVMLVDDYSELNWKSALPEFSRFFWLHGGPARAVAGMHLLVAYEASDGNVRVTALDEDGDPVWTWRGQQWARLRTMQAYPSGALLVTSEAAIFLDRQGQEVWRYAAPPNGWSPEIAPARPDDRYAWLRYLASPSAGHRIAALELATGASTAWSIDSSMSLAVGRSDGSAVVFDWQGFSQGSDELLLARPDGSLQAVMPELSAEHAIVTLHRDSRGVVAAGLGAQTHSLHALDAQLQPQWSVTRRDEEGLFASRLQLAGNASRVCLLSNTRVNASALECFDRSSGQPLFAPLTWTGLQPHLHPQVDQGIEWIYRSADPPGVLVRRRVNLNGVLLESDPDVIGSLNANLRQIHDILHSPAGHTLIHYSEQGAQGWIGGERLAILPPNHQTGQPFPTISLPEQFSSWAAAGGYAARRFAMNHAHVAILGPTESGQGLSVLDMSSGARLWRREFELGDEQMEFHVHPQGSDWMVAMLDLSQLRLSRLAAADGVPLFDVRHMISQHTREPGLNRLELDALLLSDERATAVVTARAAGTRVLWFDNDSGEFLGAAMDPLIPARSWVARTGQEPGQLVLAGQAAHPEWPASALVQLGLESRRPLENPDPQQFAGAWFNPATTGQGWFIDVLDGVNKIFGAWFTFDQWPASDASGLRWYTMLGDLPGPDGVASLDLFGNTCGSFDAGPPTSAQLMGRVTMWLNPAGGLQMALQWLREPGTEWEEVRDTVLLDLIAGQIPGQPGGIQHWFDPAIAGQGLLLGRPLDDIGPFTAAWFTYDLPASRNDLGCQHWFTAFGPPSDEPQAGRQARLLQTFGGGMDGRPTRNTVEVGDIRLTPLSCDQLLFEYEFDYSEFAGPYAGLNGQRVLQTADNCPPP